jgi:2'-5' RNA ligase
MIQPHATLRLFLAFPLPEKLIQRLAEVQQGVDSHGLQIDWTPSNAWHLTLHFLGSTDERLLEDLRHDLGACFHKHRPFDVKVSGLGCFPHPSQPKILWAGIEDPHQLLARLCEDSRRMLNQYRLFKLEEHAYIPHLTLGRIKDQSPSFDPFAFAKAMAAWSPIGTLGIEKACLYQSHLSKKGARYEVLQEYKLIG